MLLLAGLVWILYNFMWWFGADWICCLLILVCCLNGLLMMPPVVFVARCGLGFVVVVLDFCGRAMLACLFDAGLACWFLVYWFVGDYAY